MTSLLIIELMMGLTGSLHCAGMCGPIIWIMPFQRENRTRRWVALFLYHLGRISVYAILGILLYSFKAVFEPRMQQLVSVVLGFLLLVLGMLTFIPQKMIRIEAPWSIMVQKSAGRFIGRSGLSSLFVLGALNGFLPCGLVYMALSAAMAAHNSLEVAASMFTFGIGTLPMLIAITIVRRKLQFPGLYKLQKFIPVLMFSLGFLFVLRGANLGIPFISPQIEMTQQQEIKSSCCSKR